MNRQRIERVRRDAKQDVATYLPKIGDEHLGPMTPWEAYAHARATYFDALLVSLCDALLAEDDAGGVLRMGRPALELQWEEAHRNRERYELMLENWSA